MVRSSNWTVRNGWLMMPQVVSECHFSATGCQLKEKKELLCCLPDFPLDFPRFSFILASQRAQQSTLIIANYSVCVWVCVVLRWGRCNRWASRGMLLTYLRSTDEPWQLPTTQCSDLFCCCSKAILHPSHHTFLVLLISPPAYESGGCERGLRGRSQLFVATL